MCCVWPVLTTPAGVPRAWEGEETAGSRPGSLRGPAFRADSAPGATRCYRQALGGSSVMNVMLVQRGSSGDYEKWEAAGAKGWGPKAVLDYFKKAEVRPRPVHVDDDGDEGWGWG